MSCYMNIVSKFVTSVFVVRTEIRLTIVSLIQFEALILYMFFGYLRRLSPIQTILEIKIKFSFYKFVIYTQNRCVINFRSLVMYSFLVLNYNFSVA